MNTIELPPIQQRLMMFVRREFQPGFNHYSVTKLIGDASMRQYFRYTSDTRKSFILAAYPEPFDEDDFGYSQIYELLSRIDVPVPEILKLDGELGIVLQEDLGNVTLQKWLMTASNEQRRDRFRQAIDYIVAMQRDGSPLIAPHYQAAQLSFDLEKLLWEFGFFRKHYLRNYRGLSEDNFPGLDDEFRRISEELASFPRFLCHRDFHVRNLMVHEGQLFVIDFQDARWGPAAYDLVSLLKDSCDLPTQEVEDYVDYYLDKSALATTPQQFRRELHLMAVQRLSKALGTFGYQVFVRENFLYEQYMAGSLHRILLSLDQLSDFPSIQRLVESELAN